MKYYISFFSILAALFILYTFSDTLQYNKLKKTTINAVDRKTEYIETTSSKIKDIDINFTFKIDSSDNAEDTVVQIFTTGEGLKALSLRLIKPGSLQVVTEYNNADRHKVFALTDLFQYGKTHNLKIKVHKEKQLWILLDDVLVINTEDPNINIDLSKIQVDKTFEGAIADFNISYILYSKTRLASVIKPILFLFFIALGAILLKKNTRFLSRKEKIHHTAFILFAGFVMALFYHVSQSFLGYSDPKNSFLFTPGNMFTDFIGPVGKPDLITYSFFTSFVKLIFYTIGKEMSLTLFLIASGIFLALIHMKEIGSKKLDDTPVLPVVIFSLLSYPVLFVFNRGNFEILVFLLLYVFVYYFSRKKFIISAIFLSLAVSMKIFPAVFLIIFLSYRKFKEVVIAGILVIFLNAVSLIALSKYLAKSYGKIFADYMADYTSFYMKDYVIDNRGLDFNHSLYGLLKLKIFSFYKSTSITDVTLQKVTHLFTLYSKIQISLFALLSAYIIFIEKELWKKVALLVISMNLLPYSSADYKLIHFFLPLYLFINKKEGSRTDILYVILFSLLLVPKNYFNIIWNLPDVSFGIFMNPAVMIVLAVLIIGEGLFIRFAPKISVPFLLHTPSSRR